MIYRKKERARERETDGKGRRERERGENRKRGLGRHKAEGTERTWLRNKHGQKGFNTWSASNNCPGITASKL